MTQLCGVCLNPYSTGSNSNLNNLYPDSWMYRLNPYSTGSNSNKCIPASFYKLQLGLNPYSTGSNSNFTGKVIVTIADES